MKQLIVLFLIISLQVDYLKAQSAIDNHSINSDVIENYSKDDWEGQGIFRSFKPENEVTELRTRTSKHFLNSDGTITAILMAGSSINYEEDGKWHTITREIEQNNSGKYLQYPFSNTNNSFKSYYPASGSSDGILTILKEGTINEWLNPQMYYIVNGEKVNYQKINSPDIKVNGNEIIYHNIYFSIDIKFIQNNNSRKMDIIINNSNAINNAPQNATDLVFEETIKLPKTWNIKENEGCINIYNESNLWLAKYEKPVYFNSCCDSTKNNNTKMYGNYTMTKENNSLIISMRIPIQWLMEHDRKYPVFIDPTINIYPANSNYYTGTVTYIIGGYTTSYTKSNDSLYQVCSLNSASKKTY